MLVDLGKKAIPRLKPLLDDSNEAPLFGSKSATTSKAYQYRRKDFAYRYTSLILGRRAPFRRDPGQRDKDIEQLKKVLSQ
jgi:hypothetical protein